MNCQGNVNSTLPTQLPHKFSYIVAILGHNHFESPNIYYLRGIFIFLLYLIFLDIVQHHTFRKWKFEIHVINNKSFGVTLPVVCLRLRRYVLTVNFQNKHPSV
jgi:hypothetical protein